MALWALLALLPLHANQYREILGANRGHVVVVAFWATWCEPCRDELPRLQRLLQRSSARLITISADEPEQDAAVRKFLNKLHLSKAAYRIADANLIDSVDPEWRGVLPAIFIYDAEGRLKGKFFGEPDWPVLQRLITPLAHRNGDRD